MFFIKFPERKFHLAVYIHGFSIFPHASSSTTTTTVMLFKWIEDYISALVFHSIIMEIYFPSLCRFNSWFFCSPTLALLHCVSSLKSSTFDKKHFQKSNEIFEFCSIKCEWHTKKRCEKSNKKKPFVKMQTAWKFTNTFKVIKHQMNCSFTSVHLWNVDFKCFLN